MKIFEKPNRALKKCEGPQVFITRAQMALAIFGLFRLLHSVYIDQYQIDGNCEEFPLSPLTTRSLHEALFQAYHMHCSCCTWTVFNNRLYT